MTQIRAYYGATDSLNMQYVYSATQNNGQITQAIDTVSGETVDYAYDSLNRLITAATTGPQWGLSFGYDGFGNRLSQTVTKGSAPASSLSINAATNWISSGGYAYDSNGNVTTMPYGAGSMTLSYDIENRVIQAVNANGTERYGYGPDNRRVYQKKPNGSELVHFYGVNGDRLRTYGVDGTGGFSVVKTDIYFAGRRVWQNNASVFVDRLGSNRTGSRYYPFGEEQVATTNGKDKFATYSRDSSTGLDYAMNRYYGNNSGRFLTPDPYGGSAKPGDPQSWNRYAYVENDPTNKNDPTGLEISLQLHEVFGSGNCHASIRITPEDQDRWKNDPRFQQDENEKWYLTIGAGPEVLAPNTLISNLNRPNDKKPHTITSSVTRDPRMSSGENSDIETLLTSDRAYADDLNYDFQPSAEGSGYNSN